VTDVRLSPSGVRVPPSAAPWAVGVAVTGRVLAMLLRPTFGLYVAEGAGLVTALAAAGLSMYVVIAPREVSVQRWLRGPAIALAVTAFAVVLAAVPFDVMVVAGNGLRGLGNGLARSVVLRSGETETAVMRGLGLVLVVAGFRWHSTRAQWVAFAGALLVIGSLALVGHARTESPQVAVTAAVLAHVGAASAWFGGLLGLGISLHRTHGDVETSGRLIARFARTMEGVLALVLAAGVGLAILYLPNIGAFVHTAYGQVLLVKLAVLSAVLLVSAANHLRLVSMARCGNAAALRVLRTNIAVEQIGLLAIFAITAVLMRQDPRA
jgi:copper transport protein